MSLEELRAVYLFRLVCGLVAVVAYAGLMLRGYSFAKRSTSRRRRVFWITALVTLGHWVVILFVGSAYLVLHPPVLIALDPTPTLLQTYLSAAIAVGGLVMWRYCPRPGE